MAQRDQGTVLAAGLALILLAACLAAIVLGFLDYAPVGAELPPQPAQTQTR